MVKADDNVIRTNDQGKEETLDGTNFELLQSEVEVLKVTLNNTIMGLKENGIMRKSELMTYEEVFESMSNDSSASG